MDADQSYKLGADDGGSGWPWQLYVLYMPESMTGREDRSRLAGVIDRMRRTREPVLLTRRGRPVAVLVDVEEWIHAQSAVEASEDALDAADFARAIAEDDGTRITLDAVLAELGETRRVVG